MKSWRLVACLGLYWLCGVSAAWTFESIVNGASKLFRTECSLVPGAAEELWSGAHEAIQGQDEALDKLCHSISAWLHQPAGERGMLPLTIAGGTGTGKSSFVQAVARAMFSHQDSASAAPDGLLALSGKTYSTDRLVSRLERAIAQHADRCRRGVSMVVFDEAAAASSSVMDALAHIIDKQRVSLPDDLDVALRDTIVIIITDLEASDIHETLSRVAMANAGLGLEGATAGSLLSQSPAQYHKFVTQMRSKMTRMWPQSNLGHLTNAVVPFLPLGQAQVQQITRKLLQRLPGELASRRRKRRIDLRIVPAALDQLATLLSTSEYVKYVDLFGESKAEVQSTGGKKPRFRIAEAGGRGVAHAEGAVGRLTLCLELTRQGLRKRRNAASTTFRGFEAGVSPVGAGSRVRYVVDVRRNRLIIQECVDDRCFPFYLGPRAVLPADGKLPVPRPIGGS